MREDEHETLADESTDEFTSLPRGTRQLGPYLLISEIGRGAMGTVYEAEHTNLKRRVALKVLPEELASSADRYARFQREMAAIGRFEHPNIVLATDAGQVDGVCYIAMQLIQGVDLSKVLADHGKLAASVASEVVRQVALGLDEINSHGMIHRDIKPSNLLLATNGEVKILDLGIASLRQSRTGGDSLTMTGSFLGTPDYVAPEQITNCGPIDIRADIYSLGCTLYHLIGGSAPFSGPEYSSFPAKLLGHAERQPVPLDSEALGVPPGLLPILNRMIAKDRNERFSSPSDVAAALQDYCDSSSLDIIAAEYVSASEYGRSQRSRGKPINTDSIATEQYVQPASPPQPRWLYSAIGAIAIVSLLVAYAGWSMLSSINKESGTQTLLQKQTLEEQQDTGRQQLDSTRKIAQDTLAIRSSTSEIAEQANRLNSTVEGMADGTKSVAENTGKIVKTLEQLQADFSQVVDKLNSNPQTPSEWYANALIHSKSGNALEARRAYLEFFKFDLNVIDPYQKFAVLLRVQEGVAGVRETFAALPGDHGLPARRLVEISLRPEEERPALLGELIAQEPEFTPAYLELVKTQGDEFGGFLSLREQLARKQTIEKYLRLHTDGKLLRFYLDQTQAASDIARARELLQRTPNVTQASLDNPVRLETPPTTGPILVFLNFAEAAQNVAYRLPADDEFTFFDPPAAVPTGVYSMLSESLAKQMTRQSTLTSAERLEIPEHVPSGDIEIKYEDRNGVPCGPFRLKYDPERLRLDFALYFALGEKRNDRDNSGNPIHADWVEIREGWRENEPDEVGFGGLLTLSWRAVTTVKYGVNVDVPNRELRIPKSESEVKNSRRIEVKEDVRFVTLQVTFADGCVTDVYRYEKEKKR